MKDFSELIKAARLADVEVMLLQAVKVDVPGSEKSKPPIAIQVWSVEVFKAVNSGYRAVSAESVGTILKELGSNCTLHQYMVTGQNVSSDRDVPWRMRSRGESSLQSRSGWE